MSYISEVGDGMTRDMPTVHVRVVADVLARVVRAMGLPQDTRLLELPVSVQREIWTTALEISGRNDCKRGANETVTHAE